MSTFCVLYEKKKHLKFYNVQKILLNDKLKNFITKKIYLKKSKKKKKEGTILFVVFAAPTNKY